MFNDSLGPTRRMGREGHNMNEFSVHLGFEYHHPHSKEAFLSSMPFDLRPASMVNWVPKGNSSLSH